MVLRVGWYIRYRLQYYFVRSNHKWSALNIDQDFINRILRRCSFTHISWALAELLSAKIRCVAVRCRVPVVDLLLKRSSNFTCSTWKWKQNLVRYNIISQWQRGHYVFKLWKIFMKSFFTSRYFQCPQPYLKKDECIITIKTIQYLDFLILTIVKSSWAPLEVFKAP